MRGVLLQLSCFARRGVVLPYPRRGVHLAGLSSVGSRCTCLLQKWTLEVEERNVPELAHVVLSERVVRPWKRKGFSWSQTCPSFGHKEVPSGVREGGKVHLCSALLPSSTASLSGGRVPSSLHALGVRRQVCSGWVDGVSGGPWLH